MNYWVQFHQNMNKNCVPVPLKKSFSTANLCVWFDGWICSVVGNRDDIEKLMSQDEYEKYIKRSR